jgi:hypothetical protein
VARRVPRELREFLAPFPDDVAATALALRNRVLAVVPRAHEIVWDAPNAVSIVHGASERWRDDAVTHIAVYSRHVNLGFNRGAGLADPRGILEGTGARIRHAPFRGPSEVEAADWIDEYIDEALRAAGQDRSLGDGRTTVRRAQGPKRRPIL